MKKKKGIRKLLLIILALIVLVIVFFMGRQVGLNTEESKTQIITREEEVAAHDIRKTLTSSGEVSAKTTEKLELNTNKYFKAMCVEDDDTVKAGANILEYTDGTYLTAEQDLVVISHSVPETEYECKDSHYIEVSNLNKLTTTISINENEINSVAVDQEVEVTLSADESKKYTGKVTKIDSVGSYESSGATFSATIEFENDGTAKLGMSVSCMVILKEEKNAVSVPIDAVSENNEGKEYVVKIKEDGSTEEIIVETGIADDNYVQILSGLELGNKVQIQTEVTASENSNGSNSGFGGFGGGMPGGGNFNFEDMGDFDPSNMMPSGGGDRPSGGDMPSGGMPNFNQ